MKNDMKLFAKPFLKWAGGKTQLLDELIKRLPGHIRKGQTIDSYIEPFIGGGAFFYFLKANIPLRRHAYLILTKI